MISDEKAGGSARVCVPSGSPFYLPEVTASEHSVNIYHIEWNYVRGFAFPDGTSGKEPTQPMQEMQDTQVRSLGWEDPLEKGMATHSSILAWRIPWTEDPGGLQSMGS